MSTSEPTRRTPRRLLSRVLGGTFVAALLIGVPALLLWRMNGLSTVERVEAFIRARGEPTAPDELSDYYCRLNGNTAPDDRWLVLAETLAAPRLRDVAAAGPPFQSWRRRWSTGDFTTDLTDGLNEPARAWLAACHAELPEPAAVAGGGWGPLPRQSFGRRRLRDLCSHAMFVLAVTGSEAIVRGDAAAAVRSIGLLLELVESNRRHPLLAGSGLADLPMLVHALLDDPAADAAAVPDATLRRWQERLAGMDVASWYRVTKVSDFAYAAEMAADPAKAGLPMPAAYAAVWPTLRPSQTAAMYRLHEAMLAASHLPPVEARDAFDQLRKTWWQPNVLTRYQFEAYWYPDWLVHEARRQTLLVRVAAERHRRRTGVWPTTLAEMVPDGLAAVPRDPFTGKSLSYVVGADEVVCYSVGRSSSAQTPDVGWRGERRRR